VSSHYEGPLSDPNASGRDQSRPYASRPYEQWGGGQSGESEPTAPSDGINQGVINHAPTAEEPLADQPFTYREFVPDRPSSSAYPPPPQRPLYPPPGGYPPPPQLPPGGYPPPPYQGYSYPYPGITHSPNGVGVPPHYYYNGYNGYNGYPPAGWWGQPPQPKQDGYRLGVLIAGLACAILAVLGGLASTLFILLYAALPNQLTTDTQNFSAFTLFTAFALAGVIGGGFSIYHCIRGLLKKPSARLQLPWFWLFLLLYAVVIGISYILPANDLELSFLPLTIFMVTLLAIFPALSLLALGVRRLRLPAWPLIHHSNDASAARLRLSSGERQWPTSWRRFTLAITSGGTIGIGLAMLLELGFLLLLLIGGRQTGVFNFLQCTENPSAPGCGTFTSFGLIFLFIAVIGPIIEETVKPLGVALFIGRIQSAAEAFILGVSAGIGFALVETVGYISSGGPDWIAVALERTGASLLHGFGAGMVALGWYYLIHSKERRIRKAVPYWGYAVFQHFVWNGTAVLALLPDPYGTTLNSWNLNLGFTSLPFLEIVNIIEALLILTFFVYMVGRLRTTTPTTPPTAEQRPGPTPEPAVASRG
jgi:RsiW-degrading membrane proteinase PrsW (M82 family)